VRVDRVIEAGEGPHRSAATSEVLGDLPRSRARALWAATAIGICLLALAAAALRAGG
jgi:hypothetical protein